MRRIVPWLVGGLVFLIAAVWLIRQTATPPPQYLYTAEQQLVQMALRNPVQGGTTPTALQPASPRGADYHCRVASVSRNLELTPILCGWSGEFIYAYLSNGVVLNFRVVGISSTDTQQIAVENEATKESWLVLLGQRLTERSPDIEAAIKASGAIPVKRNNPIRQSSIDCPVVMQDMAGEFQRIASMGNEAAASGAEDAKSDIGGGVRRLYLSSETVNQAACSLAKALVPHKIGIFVITPPESSHAQTYFDQYNDTTWKSLRQTIGPRFEAVVWASIEKRV